MLSQGGHNVLLYYHHLDPLEYNVDEWSSFSAAYHPKNIKGIELFNNGIEEF